jgi:CubicO group peptidase (beta-lactamase class C family)
MSTRTRKIMVVSAASAALLFCAGAGLVMHVGRGIRVGTGLVSQTLCSGVFVSGLEPDQLYADAIRPIPGQTRLAKRLGYEVDRKRRQVIATWAGAFESRSVYRDGFGCTLVRAAEPDFTTFNRKAGGDAEPGNLTKSSKPIEVEPRNPRLEVALDSAFAEPSQPPIRRVKAIVILHDGKIVAERYAPGYGPDTPVQGYSLAKSVTSALIGILVRQGKLSVSQPAPVAAWSDPSDARHAITIDQLLRMTSGLAIEESDTGFDPVSRMLFLERDMAGFAVQARLKAAPGTKWEYTSGDTLILSRIIRDAVGGRAQDVVEFAQRELFEPLGITTATIEFDSTGTPVGSIYVFASARDWARFGTLYLNDGVIEGKRILPEGWVNYSASPTLDTDYGAGFWTNRGGHADAADRIDAGMPSDAFYGSGNLGQRLVIAPSAGLVIARFGFTHAPGFDMRGLLRLISATTSAFGNR